MTVIINGKEVDKKKAWEWFMKELSRPWKPRDYTFYWNAQQEEAFNKVMQEHIKDNNMIQDKKKKKKKGYGY